MTGGCCAHFGVAASAETTGQVSTNVEFDVSVRHEESLSIGVDGDELDSLQAGIDHPVDGIDSAATDADDLHDCEIVLGCSGHGP
jgi:hypothetical protein